MEPDCVGPFRPWNGTGKSDCNEEPLEDFHQEIDMTDLPSKQMTPVAACKTGCRSTVGSG